MTTANVAMENLPDPPVDYYDKFKTRPVTIKPFDPVARLVAADYTTLLERQLQGHSVEIALRGSTAWGIAGKGDIEIGVFPSDAEWDDVLTVLAARYGPPGNLEANYARFNDTAGSFEIEVIVLRGTEAELDRKLHAYMTAHPELLAEYEQVKRDFAFSRREYQRQKDNFFRKVCAQMVSD